jgi:hypothetical protein
MFRRTALVLLFAAGLAVAATPALSKGGKGGGGGSGSSAASASISLNEANPALGSSITFSSSYASGVKNPRIQVMCYQDNGATLVYGEAGSPDHVFLLGGGSSQWLANGGLASCHADLFELIWNGNNPQQVTMLASTAFDAAG